MEPQRLGEDTCVRGNHLVCGSSSKNPGPSAEGPSPPPGPAGQLSAKPTRSPATCPAQGDPHAAGTLSHPTLGSVSLPRRLTRRPSPLAFPSSLYAPFPSFMFAKSNSTCVEPLISLHISKVSTCVKSHQ